MKALCLLAMAALLLSAPVASATVLLYEDFEGSLDDWWHDTGDLWHVEDYRSYTGNNSLAYNWGDPFYDYWTPPFANSGHAYSAVVDATGASEVYMEFASWLETENTAGQSQYWYDIAHVELYDTDLNYAATLTPDINYFAQGQWNYLYTINLRPMLDDHSLDQFRVGFYFDTVDWMDNIHEGWYVDDLRITDGGQTPPVPEPSTWLLLSTGLVGAVPFVRRKLRR